VVPVAPFDTKHALVQPGQIFRFKLSVSHVHWFRSSSAHIDAAKKFTGGRRFPATTVT
jgi:hypothetical protein